MPKVPTIGGTCLIVTQFGDEPDESGTAGLFLEALIMANNLHEEHEGTPKVGCEQRISGG